MFIPVILLLVRRKDLLQWRNKVAVGPRASIPKGPPLSQKNFLKTASGKFWAPDSAGPACTARLARPIVTPLICFQCFCQFEEVSND